MKKASIQLSVNLLVVMIICLALLGMGIKLLGNFINIGNKMKQNVGDFHKEQLIKVLDQGALVASYPTRLTTTKKGTVDFSIAISNELGAAQSFSIYVEPSDYNPVLSNPSESLEDGLLYIKGPYPLQNNARTYVPIRIIMPRSAPPGSYVFKVYVCNTTEPVMCDANYKYIYGALQKLQVNVK